MAKRLTFLFILFHVSLFANSEQRDSIAQKINEFSASHDDNSLMLCYFELAKVDFSAENYESAIQNNQKSLELAHSLEDLNLQAKNYYGLGISYQRQSNFSAALENYVKSTSYDLDQIEGESLAKSYTGISGIYRSLGEYEKAYSTQMKALGLLEIANDSTGIAGCHYSLGSIFFYQKQFSQSLEHYQKAYEIIKVLDSPRLLYSCLGALGSAYDGLDQFDKAFDYNYQSLELAKKIDYKTGIAYSLGNLANHYAEKEELIKAEDYLKESIKIKEQIGDTWGVIGSKTSLAEMYMDGSEFHQAIEELNQALDLAQEIDSKVRQAEINKQLASAYGSLKNIKKAHLHLGNYVSLKDSLINEKMMEEMGQSKRRYEIQGKEHEISMLKKANELLGKDKKIQKLQIYIFAIAGLLLLVFTGWFMNRLKYSRKMNAVLGEKNHLLNSLNDEIKDMNKQLEYSNQDLSQFAYVASHDLKEPLRMIHSYTSLLKKRYSSAFDESGNEFMFFITDAVGRMQTLLDDLLDFSRAGNQKGEADPLNIKDVMEIVKANLRHRIEQNACTLNINMDNMPIVKAHRTQMVQLLQNLVSNGLKFRGEADPVVDVDCTKKDGKYIFSIRDNGIGISKENQEKVFEMFRRLHTREEYEGTGIGLATCKRIVNLLGGDLWLTSEEGKGSTFFFSLPVPKEEPVLA